MNKDENKSNNCDNVRQRLLDVAEKLFAENGFDGTAVRSLTTEAQCNVAAVNYHFGGKDKLYLEIMKRRMVDLREIRINRINEVMAKEGTGLEELLREFSWAFLDPHVDGKSGARLMKLMLREMLDPQLPSDMFFAEVIKPVTDRLLEALLKVCPGIDEMKACFCIHSVVAQLLHTLHTTKMISRIESSPCEAPKFEDFVDHIVEFTAIGIRGIAAKSGVNSV